MIENRGIDDIDGTNSRHGWHNKVTWTSNLNGTVGTNKRHGWHKIAAWKAQISDMDGMEA